MNDSCLYDIDFSIDEWSTFIRISQLLVTHFVLVISFCAQYLDENKQLILAILDNQNLGKLNECATYVSYVSPLLLCPIFNMQAVEMTGFIV